MFSTKKLVTLSILSAMGVPLMFISIPPVPAAPWLKFDLSDLVVFIGAVIYGPIGAFIIAFVKSTVHYLIKGTEVGIPLNQLIAFVSSLAFALPFYYTLVIVRKIMKKNNKIGRLSSYLVSSLFFALSLSYLSAQVFRYTNTSLLGTDSSEVMLQTLIIMPIYILISIALILWMVRKYTMSDGVIVRLTSLFIGTLSLTVIMTVTNYLWFTPLYFKLLGYPLPDEFLRFIAMNYAPFNFAKGVVLSAIFFILSFRLDQLVGYFDLCNEDNCKLFDVDDDGNIIQK